MNWTIYYGDGTTYNSTCDGSIDYAPTRDVQVIVQPCKTTGWAMQHTADYYVWREDMNEWRGTDIFGLWDYLAGDGWKKVLFGRTLRSEEFDEIYQRAKQDRNERKTSFQPSERHPCQP